MTKVSIVVPCWGVEKYLDKCVESLVNQTLQDIEIILVDDESPDKVPQMCDEWAKRDARIKVIHKKNEGLGMACNSGIEVANGEYIAFCDSDDWVDVNMYEQMYNEATLNCADAVFTNFNYVDIDGNQIINRSANFSYKKCDSDDSIKDLMKNLISSAPHIRSEHIVQGSAKLVLYSKRIIEETNIRFVSERDVPSEDIIFNLNFVSHCKKIILLPKRFYNYRTNPLSITHSISKDVFQKTKIKYNYLCKLVNSLNLGNDGIYRVQRITIGSMRMYISRLCKQKMMKNELSMNINSICCDPIWQEIWKSYPIYKMPKKHLLFFFAMRFNLHRLIILLSSLI